jgi:hypothetical protein
MHGTESAAASGAKIVEEASLGGKQLALGFVWPRSLRSPRASRTAEAVETAISYVTVSGHETGEHPRAFEGSSRILYCALHQTPIMVSSILRVFMMAGKNALVRGGHFVHL